MLAAAALLWIAGCADPAAHIHWGPAPSQTERYCAWYGDDRSGVLYFGQSAFWSATRRTGAPAGVLERAGPAPIGRFDLRSGELLDPIEVGDPSDRAGVWDVFAHSNGRVYFTTLFSNAGWVDLASGEVTRLPGLGEGLNEIAPGPGETLLFTRYFGAEPWGGSLLVTDLEGRPVAEHPLRPPPGYLTAPKTPAWDPVRDHFWVTADVLPGGSDQRKASAIRRGAYVLAADGAQLAYTEHPEIQFVAFGPDGAGYRAEASETELALRIVPPDASDLRIEAGRRIVLDRAFHADLDFAQELRVLPDGRALVTRWSGRVHVVQPEGEVRTITLPRVTVGGLYYTGVLGEGRICVTHCGGVEVVCVPEGG